MLGLSHLIQRVKPSPTLAASARAQELKAEGRDIISLTVGEPDMDTPQHVKDAAVEALSKGLTKYTAAGGTPALKKVICEKLQRDQGVSFVPQQIVVTNGGKQALAATCAVLLNPGDEAIIPAPYWTSYPDMVMMVGGEPKIVETSPKNGYLMTANAFRGAITDRTRMVILNSPSNPTGCCYSAEELRALADVIKQAPGGDKICIVSDEVYEYITFDNVKPVSIIQVAPELKDQIVICNAFSKAYSMTGWRVGYVAAPLHVAKAIDMHQSQFTSNVCSIAQYAASKAYEDNYDFPRKMCGEFEKRRQIVCDAVNEMPGVELPLSPKGAFYAFLRIEGLAGKKNGQAVINNGADFAAYLLEQYNVAVVSGDAFGDPMAIRMSFALGTDNLRKALERIHQAAASLS